MTDQPNRTEPMKNGFHWDMKKDWSYPSYPDCDHGIAHLDNNRNDAVHENKVQYVVAVVAFGPSFE